MKELNLNDESEELDEVKINKKPLIDFAKLNKYFLIPFICPIFCMLTNYFYEKLEETKSIKEEIVINLLYNDLSSILGGLIYFISYFRQKTDKRKEFNNLNNDNKNNNINIEYIYNETSFNNSNKFMILEVILALLSKIRYFLIYYYCEKNIFNERLYYMFYMPLFSKLILKENIYKHQCLSLMISIIGMILVIIPTCIILEKDDILPNLINLFNGGINPLFLVIIKYMYNVYYISPLYTGIVYGIISLIFTMLGYIIYSLIKYHDLSFFNNIFDFEEVENYSYIIFLYIITFLFLIILQSLTFLSLIYFSPVLIIVTEIISPMLLWTVKTIEKGEWESIYIFYPIGYIILLISSLIFNEIIILNFYGFNNNTNKYVKQRMNKEISELQILDNDIYSDSNLDDEN